MISDEQKIGKAFVADAIPSRPTNGHKGTFGKVLVIGGSVGMSGAAYLCAKSILRTGAGMVRILSPEENRIPLQVLVPEAVLACYRTMEEALRQYRTHRVWADVIVIGPGLGLDDTARILLEAVLTDPSDRPVIVDADALTILSDDLTRLSGGRDVFLTPHVGEMRRLCGEDVPDDDSEREALARRFATEHGVYLAIKSAQTVVAGPDGSVFWNDHGTNGMATAGSGDVLTGITGGLLARGTDPACVLPCAVYLHGEAGIRAADKYGTSGMTAGDMPDMIGLVLEEWSR